MLGKKRVCIRLFSLVSSALVVVCQMSCSSTPESVHPEVDIVHSSPDVISLYDQPVKRKQNGFLNSLLDGMLSSSPDSDDDWMSHSSRGGQRDKDAFTKENRTSIERSLKNKR